MDVQYQVSGSKTRVSSSCITPWNVLRHLCEINLILYYWDILSRRSSRDPIFLLPSNHHGHRYYFMETPHWCFFAENWQQSLHTHARKLCETLCSLHETLLGHDFSYCDLLHLVTRCYLHGYWIKPWPHNTFYTSVFKPLQHYQTYWTQANPLSAPFKELWFLHC